MTLEKVFPERLGDFILRERDKFYSSREAFAKKIGLHSTTIESIENAETKSPGLKAILAIAEGLKVSPMKLISIYTGEDPSSVEDSKQMESSILEFVGHLPVPIVLQALFSKPEEEVFENFLRVKGRDKVLEIMRKVRDEAK